MNEILFTDFLHSDKNNDFPKKYFELPVFNEKYDLKKNIIFFKEWDGNKKKSIIIKKNLKLYDHFLDELTIFLNNYHNKNFSKRYWSILIGQWLYKFISTISFKWNLINSLKKKKYIFLKKEIITKDIIPLGIEDYSKISQSHYWNHYINTKIIEHSFSNKFKIKKTGRLIKNNEKKIIYQKLRNKNLKDKISLLIQKIFNFFPQNKNVLIFSTYMSNLQELELNLLINKSLLYYKMLRPYLLFEKKNLFEFDRRNTKKLKSLKIGFESFLSKEILSNIPSAYLENYKVIETITNSIPFPKAPKKIFTTLGINRSTLMNQYIAKNIEDGSSLILAQHGGIYFQEEQHFSTIFEKKISDKFLSWGNTKEKNVIPIGVIKNLRNNTKRTNKIILEIRKRNSYTGEIKIDSGFLEAKRYLDNMCVFFSLLKGKEISENLYIKLHSSVKSFWQDKNQFLHHNPKLKFLDKNKDMIKEINSAKLIIHTYLGTGHLESLAINKPTLILMVNDLSLLNKKSIIYIKKLIKFGIVHRTPESLLKTLERLDDNKLENWWNNKERQNLLKKYRNDFCFFNNKKIKDLKKIINNV